jgi:glycosyltransferase involved in cell wall biosynthesis
VGQHAAVAPLSATPARITVLCGSAAPFACGVHDYSERLNAEFTRRGMEVSAMHEPITLSSMPSMLRKLGQSRPDVLLMQYPNAAYGSSLAPHLLANAARGMPFVLVLHEFEPAHALRKLSIALLAGASAIIVTNDVDRAHLVKWYPWVARRVWTVPLASNIPRRPWRPGPDFTVVHFGLLRPAKGLEEFLECARIVQARTPRIRFKAIGALTEGAADYGKAFLEEARGLGMEVLLGAAAEEVASALSAASVAYLPFPDGATARRGSILAAASCGLPVVSTIGPFTTPELAAAVLGASSPGAAAELLLSLLDDETRLRDAHARSERFGRTFTWESLAERYLDVFNAGCALSRAS